MNNSVSDYGAALEGNKLKESWRDHCGCQLLGRTLPGNGNKNTFRKILSLAVFMVRGLSQKGKLQPDGFWKSVYSGNSPFLENLQGPPTLVKVIL